jgi:dsRNA-specific ribonuclease
MREPSRETAALRAAEAELAAAAERGREAMRHAREVAARVPQSSISDEDIRQIERAARGKDAPPELRALAERVQRGELSWRQIVGGHAMHDPGVQAAMQTNLARLGRAYRQFEEGYTLDEILDRQPPARLPRPAATDAADDEGHGGTVRRHSSW